MKKLNWVLCIIVLGVACTQPNSSIDEIEQEIEVTDQDSESRAKTISKTAVRIGGSGTGIDIVVRNDNADEIFILGENKKIYRYNSSTGKFDKKGNSTGKRISATQNKLLLCGSNDKIYYRNMSSTGSWSQLSAGGVSTCADIVGNRNASSLNNNSVSIIEGNHTDLNYYSGTTWISITEDIDPGSHLHYSTDIGQYGNSLSLRSSYYDCFLCPIYYRGGYVTLSGPGAAYWVPFETTQMREEISEVASQYYISKSNEIVNSVTLDRIVVSGRTPDRLSVANDGTIYFIDGSNRGVYRVN